MKTILTLIFTLNTIILFAQTEIEPIVPNDCKLYRKTNINFQPFSVVRDTTAPEIHQETNQEPDTQYYSLNKLIPDTRLIYFVHGLGGNDKSWDAVDDAHTNQFVYTPLRVDYEEHQRDFDEASFEVYNEMNRLRLSALNVNGQTMETEKPYAIGHSQGGLVLRDMDRKYEQNYDAHFKQENRQFYGLITFCTPHTGAKIATSQEELRALSADFSKYLGNAVLKNQVAKFSLKYPFLSKHLQKLSTSASSLVESLATDLIPTGINIMSKGQQAPMTNQYAVNASFLKNELNFSNDQLPKALFYAKETDPILFKIATFMVGPSASDFVHYDRFGANDDMQIANGVNELRAKLIADKTSHEATVEKLKKKINRTNIPIIGLGYLLTVKSKRNQLKIHEEAIEAESDAIAFIEQVNKMYKVIIGSLKVNPFGSKVKTGYWCVTDQKIINIKLPFAIKRDVIIDIKHKVDTKDQCTGIKTVPIYENRIIEYPSDAVLTVESQTAFPGCHDRYKHELNEVSVYDSNGQLIGVKTEGAVNHIQMLNCTQTDEALRRIYEGRGVPEFFRLREK